MSESAASLTATTEAVRFERISKRFGGVLALNDVSFSIATGEVHAIVGENGAGKSTIMKVLAGVHEPDGGVVYLAGKPVRLPDPLVAQRQGIGIVFQELNLFPHLSVAANVFTNHELVTGTGVLAAAEMRRRTAELLESLGVELDPDARAGTLSVAQKQIVEIARALSLGSQILVMDEPNSALTDHETRTLFAIIRRLRDQGITVVYVSHRIEEVFTICDRITVLRDGRFVATWPIGDVRIADVVSAMIGRPLEETYPERPPLDRGAKTVVDVRGLEKHGRLGPLDFTVRHGEVVGFAGLEGSGIDELLQLLFGLEQPDAGAIAVDGEVRSHSSAAASIRDGWALVPANRREQGLMLDWSIRLNMTLPILARLAGRLGLLGARRERELVEGQFAPSGSPPTAPRSGWASSREAMNRRSSLPSGWRPGPGF